MSTVHPVHHPVLHPALHPVHPSVPLFHRPTPLVVHREQAHLTPEISLPTDNEGFTPFDCATGV